jgi:hypothetical protein
VSEFRTRMVAACTDKLLLLPLCTYVQHMCSPHQMRWATTACKAELDCSKAATILHHICCWPP